MPSKGINVYSYIAVDGVTIDFTVPKGVITNTAADNFTCKDLEVESTDIPGKFTFTGRFQWTVHQNGNELASAYNDINSLSGRLEGGTMTKTGGDVSIIKEGLIISYGFYDAGKGMVGLPSKNQCWVTVTPDHENWMGLLAPEGSEAATKPFSRFVLAAPHDDGMNNLQSADTVLNDADEDMVRVLTPHIPALQWFADVVPANMLMHLLPDIIYGLAITQKDPIPTMLHLGARYFEFRPADLFPAFQDVSPIPSKPHFEHACIPGLAFDDFLDQQVQFLDAHLTEIVTIHIRWDGIVSECRKPTMPEIENHLNTACGKATNHITWGGHECFSQPIQDLRRAGQRLIVVVEAGKYDSWTAEAYATLSADTILARFESMNTEGQQSTDLTILQCQATSQSIKEVLVYSVVASNASTSCLTSTKGSLDHQTLPWIRANALDRLQAEKTIVIMNDFIDGATTDTSVELSRRRLMA